MIGDNITPSAVLPPATVTSTGSNTFTFPHPSVTRRPTCDDELSLIFVAVTMIGVFVGTGNGGHVIVTFLATITSIDTTPDPVSSTLNSTRDGFDNVWYTATVGAFVSVQICFWLT